MGVPTMSPVLAQSGVEAEAVMAAFVHRFTQFVEWPSAALQDRDQFGICVAASREFSEAIRRLVEGSAVSGRPLVSRETGPGELEGCHVLFVSADVDRADAFVEAVADEPILTVSDSPGFLDMGGMIELRIIERHIRFGVNSGSATRAGLRLSSQLLDLALEVRGGPS